MTKIIKRFNYYSYSERLEKIGSSTLLERRMSANLIGTFKMINQISNHGRHFFNISPRTENLLSRQISKIKSTNQFDFFANRVIYFSERIA